MVFILQISFCRNRIFKVLLSYFQINLFTLESGVTTIQIYISYMNYLNLFSLNIIASYHPAVARLDVYSCGGFATTVCVCVCNSYKTFNRFFLHKYRLCRFSITPTCRVLYHLFSGRTQEWLVIFYFKSSTIVITITTIFSVYINICIHCVAVTELTDRGFTKCRASRASRENPVCSWNVNCTTIRYACKGIRTRTPSSAKKTVVTITIPW